MQIPESLFEVWDTSRTTYAVKPNIFQHLQKWEANNPETFCNRKHLQTVPLQDGNIWNWRYLWARISMPVFSSCQANENAKNNSHFTEAGGKQTKRKSWFKSAVAETNQWVELTVQQSVPALSGHDAACMLLSCDSALQWDDQMPGGQRTRSLILRHWGRLFPSMQTMTLHAAQLIFNSPPFWANVLSTVGRTLALTSDANRHFKSHLRLCRNDTCFFFFLSSSYMQVRALSTGHKDSWPGALRRPIHSLPG